MASTTVQHEQNPERQLKGPDLGWVPRLVTRGEPAWEEAPGIEDWVKVLRRRAHQIASDSGWEDGTELPELLEKLIESMADGILALDFRGRPVYISGSLSEKRSIGEGAWVSSDRDPSARIPRSVLQELRRGAANLRPGEVRRLDISWERVESGASHYQVVAVAGWGSDASRAAASPGHGPEGPKGSPAQDGIHRSEIFPAPDRPELTLFAFRDRTREILLEAELVQARQMAALGQMAATVAHELRNPLGAIQGFATLLKRDLAGQEGPLRQVDRILRGVESADRIVGDLLVYCRPLHFQPEALFLPQLLEESLMDLQSSSRRSADLRIDLELDPELPPCCGDRRLILLVLANLYNNAVDAMEGQGTLSIRARRAGPTGCPDRLRLVIRDTGCGLTAEEVAKIFAPFYTTKPGGTGLGLALVRKIVEAHDGHVHVVSAPARGTSVVLDLPAAALRMESEPTHRRVKEAA